MSAVVRPIDTALVLPARLRRPYRAVQPLVEAAFSFPALWRLYDDCAATGLKGPDFASDLLRRLGVQWMLPDADAAALRAIEGPLVVVANHPHGGLDALILVQVLARLRPGAWSMFANQALCAVPEFAERLIPVDPLGRGAASLRLNATGLRAARRFLQNPDALFALFPAGRVSHREPGLGGAICDRAWTDHGARLAAAAGASLAVLHLTGGNSPRFLAIPPDWKHLRALCLCRELVHPPARRVEVRLAAVLPPSEVVRLVKNSPVTAGARLRARCFLRADRDTPRALVSDRDSAAAPPPALCPQTSPDILAAEIAALSEKHRLLRSSDEEIDVLLFRGERSPALMRELGRAREITFRAAGQGSGQACDLSPEDDYYEHLVLWHRPSRRLMGAYRLGFTRDIIEARGPGGLYLDHIFKIDPAFYEKLGPAIELSRSFVLPDYQRDNRALALLWRGLGAAATARACTTFFGSVTVSNQQHPATRALLSTYLARAHADTPALRSLVRARRPFVPTTRYHGLVAEAYSEAPIEALAPLVNEIEGGARGIPPLMRYYCSLGAKFLAYHVEPTFQDALYCLLRVDLRTIPEGYRRRFLE